MPNNIPRPSYPALAPAALAWEFGLRDYDSMHLATALNWQGTLETPVCLATFDRTLWTSGQKAWIKLWPEILDPV